MLCPTDNIECEQYGHYNSIGRCPKCGNLFTTKSGDDIQIFDGTVGEKNELDLRERSVSN